MSTWTTLARGPACGSGSCPAIYRGDTGQLFVQGRRASDEVRTVLGLKPDEDAVEISEDLLARALTALRRPNPGR